jgi:hypothetical protein
MLSDVVEFGNEYLIVDCMFCEEIEAATALPADSHIACRDVMQSRHIV